jgi:hypothetical protein
MKFQAQQEMYSMNDGAVTCDVANVDGVVDTPRGVVRSGDQQATADRPADDDVVVLLDTRGQQVNPLPTRMTVAEALDDSLGPRC